MPDEIVSPFRADAREVNGTLVIDVQGELDLVGAPLLLQALPAEGTSPVVLDLEGVRFMDSSGLRSLLEARQACADAGRGFAITRPSAPVSRVLELVDLAREFERVEPPS